jgi:hypothetical protein
MKLISATIPVGKIGMVFKQAMNSPIMGVFFKFLNNF